MKLIQDFFFSGAATVVTFILLIVAVLWVMSVMRYGKD